MSANSSRCLQLRERWQGPASTSLTFLYRRGQLSARNGNLISLGPLSHTRISCTAHPRQTLVDPRHPRVRSRFPALNDRRKSSRPARRLYAGGPGEIRTSHKARSAQESSHGTLQAYLTQATHDHTDVLQRQACCHMQVIFTVVAEGREFCIDLRLATIMQARTIFNVDSKLLVSVM